MRGFLRFALSFGLLFLLLVWLDNGEILTRLLQLDLRWVLLALGLSVLQILLLAWRWRFTAARLGLRMPYAVALREYYLGVFLNQLLPGAVLGDVSRAWRHARATARVRAAVHAVVLERVMLQSVMLTAAALSLLALPAVWPRAAGWPWLAGAVLLAAAALTILMRQRLAGLRPALSKFARDAGRAFLPASVLTVQVATSLLVVAGHLLIFVAAARAVGSEAATAILLPLIAPVLVAMMLPFTVAGWGLREAAAALLWGLSGLSPAEGMAIAVAYGLVFLAAALPGALPLLLPPGAVRPNPSDAARTATSEPAHPQDADPSQDLRQRSNSMSDPS
jgi:glycosyltransferase 2 family protein